MSDYDRVHTFLQDMATQRRIKVNLCFNLKFNAGKFQVPSRNLDSHHLKLVFFADMMLRESSGDRGRGTSRGRSPRSTVAPKIPQT